MNDPSYSIFDRPVVQTGVANDDAARIIDAVAGYPLGMIQHDASWYLCADQSYAYRLWQWQSCWTNPRGHAPRVKAGRASFYPFSSLPSSS